MKTTSQTRLRQAYCNFDLTGTSHIVHSLDREVDTPYWNLCGHNVDMPYPTGLCGGTGIAVNLLTYKAVWSEINATLSYILII